MISIALERGLVLYNGSLRIPTSAITDQAIGICDQQSQSSLALDKYYWKCMQLTILIQPRSVETAAGVKQIQVITWMATCTVPISFTMP